MTSPADWPQWVVMCVIALTIFAACKGLTWRLSPARATWWKHVGYLLAWPGMDAHAFLTRRPVDAPRPADWAAGAAKFALGLSLLFGVARIGRNGSGLAGWIGMIGIVLMLHFGVFHLLSCAWRRIGVAARPVMDRPLTSVSLSEFWGRRWNTAYRDLTHRFLFRPLTAWFGPRGAIVSGFAVSGLVHDLVISVPARGGYGGPTFYFITQAAGMLAERSEIGRRLGLGRGWTGRTFTIVVLVAPLSWLFHPPFIERVVVPFMRASGAL